MIAKLTLALLFVGSFGTPSSKTNHGWNVRYDSPLKQSRIQHHLSDPELQGNIGKVPQKTRSTIVRGNEATPHEYPWQVLIRNPFNETHSTGCGGSLISDQWVLTAAHCFDRREAFKQYNSIVYLGAHDLSQAEVTRIRMNGSHELVVHQRYSHSDLKNDIALLKLSQRIEFNNFIRPITLPCPNFKVEARTILTAIGWGRTENDIFSDVLLEVDVPVINHAYCVYLHDLFGSLPVKQTNICTDTFGGHGACKGDSGGPLIYKVGGVSKIIGITSFGHPNCTDDLPDVFTEVNNYRDWIHSHTGI